MATLTNTKIKDTYDGLLKTTDNDVIGTTEKVITDGLGNASILSIGTQSASFSEDIKINGQAFGVGAGNVATNIAIGIDSLTSNTTGSWNTVLGGGAAYLNTTGAFNIAISGSALFSNTTGSHNIALGNAALRNITGSYNIAMGYQAGYYSTGTLNKTAGDYNIYIGTNTVSGGQDTDNEIVIGYNTTGNGSNTATYGNSSITDHYFDGNVRADFFYGDGSNLTNLPSSSTPTLEDVVTSAVGANTSSINLVIAGANLGTITNDSNTLFGERALASHTSGSYNTAIGWEALTSYTGGSDNTAVGSEALHNLNTGANNTAIGVDALRGGTSLNSNTAIGNRALLAVSGDSNVALGYRAGELRNGGTAKSAGDYNVYIGSNTISALSDTDNEIVIGANAIGNGSNTATLGSVNTTSTHLFGDILFAQKLSSPIAGSINHSTDNFLYMRGGTSGLCLSDDGNDSRIRILDNSIITFTLGSSERFRLSTNGGVTVYNGYLDFNTNISTPSTQTAIYKPANDTLAFSTNSEERMRIDSSGNVGIGKSNPSSTGYGKRLWISSTTGGQPEGQLYLEGNRSLVGQNVGAINFVNNGGVICGISGMTDSPNISNSGLLRFFTFNNGTEGERMRITSGGQVLIGKQAYGTANNGIEFDDAASYARMTNSVPSGGGNNCYHVYNTSIPTYVFYVQANGGIANYQANNVNLSDERVKTDIKPLSSYWDKFKALELVTFKYTNQDHNDNNIGLIAQQVESVAPEFVSNDGFAYTSDDEEPLKAIYTTDLYHASMKVLQEAMQKIETLEAKVATLESQLNA